MKEKYGLDWEDYLNSVVFDEIDKLNKAGDSLWRRRFLIFDVER